MSKKQKKEPEIDEIIHELQKAHDIYLKRFSEIFQEYQARVNNALGKVNGHNSTN